MKNSEPRQTPVLSYWMSLFILPQEFISIAYDCIGYWPDSRVGEREVLFFLQACDTKTRKSYCAKTNRYFGNAPCYASLLSVKMALQTLADTGATFDEILSTAYLKVRFDSTKGCYALNIGVNYKGRVLKAKLNNTVRDIQVNLVFSNDQFKWRGSKLAPTHKYDVFSPLNQRGKLLSGYSVTYKTDGTLYVNSVDIEELKARFELAEDAEIAAQWKEKMLLKTIVCEAEKGWHYTRNSLDMTKTSFRKKLSNTYDAISNLNALPPSFQSDRVFLKAMSYAIGFYTDHKSGIREMENLVFSIVGKPDLVESSNSSLISILLTLEKYGLSLIPSKSHCYVFGRAIGDATIASLKIMYLGMREIAFGNVFNSPQGAVNNIEYTLVHEHDSFVYKGRHKKPSFKFDPNSDRGEVIGGFVVTERNGIITNIIRNDYLSKIADCSKTTTVRSKWPKKYAEKSILKQCFFEWL